jgi:hypothetical protein
MSRSGQFLPAFVAWEELLAPLLSQVPTVGRDRVRRATNDSE